MPFQSKSQMRWAFATGQPFAKRWAKKTKNPDRLPVRKKENDKKSRGLMSRRGE